VTDQDFDEQTHPEEDELVEEQRGQGGATAEDEDEREPSLRDEQ
jgi:hypothetical protein